MRKLQLLQVVVNAAVGKVKSKSLFSMVYEGKARC